MKRASEIVCSAEGMYAGTRMPRGMTLVEVVLAIVMVSVLAGAVSLAIYQGTQRTGQLRTELTAHQSKRAGIGRMTDEFRWTQQVNYVDSKEVWLFTGDPCEWICYHWESLEKKLYRSDLQGNDLVVLSGVKDFNIDADEVRQDDQGDWHVASIFLELEFTDNPGVIIRRYVHLMNQPEW